MNLYHASYLLKRTARTFQQFFLIQQICPHSSHPKPSTCQLNSVHPYITSVTKLQPAEFAQRLPHAMVRIPQGCIFHLLCFPGENRFQYHKMQTVCLSVYIINAYIYCFFESTHLKTKCGMVFKHSKLCLNNVLLKLFQ